MNDPRNASRHLTDTAISLLLATVEMLRLGRRECAEHLDGLADDMLQLALELQDEATAALLAPCIEADRAALLEAGAVPKVAA